VKVTCEECGAGINVPGDVVKGEIVTCPDCGVDYEVTEASSSGVTLQPAETSGEDWGE